jgi:hypothetical protein
MQSSETAGQCCPRVHARTRCCPPLLRSVFMLVCCKDACVCATGATQCSGQGPRHSRR